MQKFIGLCNTHQWVGDTSIFLIIRVVSPSGRQTFFIGGQMSPSQ